jgi:hypothetical protein
MARAPVSPSELVSGPDLGGGYLHQLSIDRLEEATTFTHHAQDGGQDAGGPPIGALDVLGFVHPRTPCMFGGPNCWHRRYLLPFAATPKVRFAYQRHRFVLETMLRQAHGLAPTAFDAAVRELVARVAGPLRKEGVEWYVAGSGAVRLAGGGGTPHDIDLGTTRAGVDRLGELLAEYLIEPVAPTDWRDERLVVGGRAFVGTPKAGARVEWAVPLEPREPRPWEELVGLAGVTRTIDVLLDGAVRVPVSRPEYALVRAAERGRTEGVDASLAAIRSVGVDPALLDVLLERSTIPPESRPALRARALG